jgi:hypothetical protein
MVDVFLFAQEQLGFDNLVPLLKPAFIPRWWENFPLVLQKPSGELAALLLREIKHLFFDFGETHRENFTFAGVRLANEYIWATQNPVDDAVSRRAARRRLRNSPRYQPSVARLSMSKGDLGKNCERSLFPRVMLMPGVCRIVVRPQASE